MTGGEDNFDRSADGGDDNFGNSPPGGSDNFDKTPDGGDNDFGLLSGKHQSHTTGLIDYDNFSVDAGVANDTWFLTVSGKLPSRSMRVELRPVYYIDKPEYWRIEVVGWLPAVVSSKSGSFSETIPVTDFIGHKGIELFGANRSDKWEEPQ